MKSAAKYYFTFDIIACVTSWCSELDYVSQFDSSVNSRLVLDVSVQ